MPPDRRGISWLKPCADAGYRRRQRKVTVIDFENLPPLAEDTFKLATRKEQICVKTQAVKDTLLPKDLHFEVRSLPGEMFQTLSSAHHSASVLDMPSAETCSQRVAVVSHLCMRMIYTAAVRLRL